MTEAFKVIWDIISIINDIIQSIGNAEANSLSAIETQLPGAIDKVLTHPDFTLMYNAMIPIGIALAVLFTSLDIMEKISITDVTIDQIILTIAKLIISIAIINNGIVVFEGLNAVATYSTELIKGALSLSDINAISSLNPVDTEGAETAQGFFMFIVYIISILNPATLVLTAADLGKALILALCIPIIAYQRAIKIGYYCLAAPIVFADTAGHGVRNSKAITYTFNLLKTFMEFPVIYFSVYLCYYLEANDLALTDLVLVFMITKCLFGSKEFLKTIID